MASTWTRHQILNNKNISVENNNLNTKKQTTKYILVPPKPTFLELPRITVIYVAIMSLRKPPPSTTGSKSKIPPSLVPFHVSCFVKYFYDNEERDDTQSLYHSFIGEDCVQKFLTKLSEIGDSFSAELAKMNRNSVPVVIHEFSKFASHFKPENLSRFRFVDPVKFLIDCTIIDRLMENSVDRDYLAEHFNTVMTPYTATPEQLAFVKMENSAIPLPIDFLDDSEKLNLEQLPSNFDGRAREAWEVFGCQNLEEYAELHAKFKVLSLCYVVEKLRDKYKKDHKLEMLDY